MADTDDVIPFATRFRCPHCPSWLFIITDPQQEFENTLVHGDLLAEASQSPPGPGPAGSDSTRPDAEGLSEHGSGPQSRGPSPGGSVGGRQPEAGPAEQRVETRSLGYDFECDECDRKSMTKRGLVSHKRIVHGTGAGGKKYVCEVCKEEFDTGSALGGHRKTHRKDRESSGFGSESGSHPAVKSRLTAALVSRCVLAVLEGRQIGEWIAEERFRGNKAALTAWTNAVVHSVDAPSYRQMSPEERERTAQEIIRTRGGTMVGRGG